MAVYIGHEECQVIYVAKNGQQRRVSSIWVGDQQVFPPANRQETHFFNRSTQGYGRTDNGTFFGFTVEMPWWATSLDVVIIGAGEKGRDGTKSFTGGTDGAGGRSGAWVVATHSLTTSSVASIVVGKGTTTTPYDTYVYIPGAGEDSILVTDSQGTRTPNNGSTGGTPSPQIRTEYGDYHHSAAGGARNNAGGHPGGGGGGGQGSGLIGNPTTGQPGGDGYVWLRFRSAPLLDPGEVGFILRVGVTSGWAYNPLREWAVGIGKTHQTITEITVPMEVIGPSLYALFYECSSLTAIPALDTSQVTNMGAMFAYCLALTSAPELDTSQVTNMGTMFQGCSSLTSAPDMITSQVTDMRLMFGGCSSLTAIPALDTSQVTDMYAMFQGCSSLTTIPDLNTSQVTNMASMFGDCSSLTAIPAMDTSQVTNMRSIFFGCEALTSVPELDTSQVTDMYGLFAYCQALTSIPDLDTSHVADMEYMFYNCSSLTTVPDLGTSQVTNMKSMFEGCSSLTTIPALDASKVTNTGFMFQGCSSLESVTLPGMGNGFTTRQTLGMRDTKLNAAAANALMQSLGTPPPGGGLNLPATATGANTSIATAKNWTVTIG